MKKFLKYSVLAVFFLGVGGCVAGLGEEEAKPTKEAPVEQVVKKEEPKKEEPKIPSVSEEAKELHDHYVLAVPTVGGLVGELSYFYSYGSSNMEYTLGGGLETDVNSVVKDMKSVLGALQAEQPQNPEVKAVHDKVLNGLTQVISSTEYILDATLNMDIEGMETGMTQMEAGNDVLISAVEEMNQLK